jgi:hypothetical protein
VDQIVVDQIAVDSIAVDGQNLATASFPRVFVWCSHLFIVSFFLCLFTSFRDIAPLLLSNAGKSLSLRSETNDLLTSSLFHSLHFTDQNVAKTIDGSTSSGGGVGSLKSLKFSFYLPSNEKEMTMLMNLLNITVGKLCVGKGGTMGHEEPVWSMFVQRGTSEPVI